MTRADHLRQVFEKHLKEIECLDRIEYVETDNSYKGRPNYVGPVRVLTK